MMWKQPRALGCIGLLFVHGGIVGAFAEWPGLSMATLLLAFGHYAFCIDNFHALLKWPFTWINTLSSRTGYRSSTTKVCCPLGGNSGLNEQNQIIAQSEAPYRSGSRNNIASQDSIDSQSRMDSQHCIHRKTGARDTDQCSFVSGANVGLFLVLLAGTLVGMFGCQPWVLQWGTSHRILANALALGVVLSAVMQLLITTRLMGLKKFFALLLGLFCMHALPMLPSWVGGGFGGGVLSGIVGAFTCYLPGVSFDFSQAIIGHPVFLSRMESHVTMPQIGFGLGIVLALIVLTFLFFVMKNKAQGLLRLFLAGLMVATFPLLWPWQQVDDYLLTGAGQAFPLSVTHLSPSTYAMITGEPAHLPGALVCILAGFMLTCLTGRQGFKNTE
ncbi:hypothetical protein LMG33818_001087 [Halomonadaceae bacterium LMG 33818]